MFETNISEIEKNFLGSILMDPESLKHVSGIVKPSDFFHEFHAKIYETCLKLDASNEPVEIGTLLFAMKSHPRFVEDNGVYMMSIYGCVPSSLNVIHYAKLIKKDSTRRQIHSFAESLLASTEATIVDMSEFSSKMVQELTSITDDVVERKGCDLKEAVKQAFVQIEEASKNGGKPSGILTGFSDLDTYLGGLRPGSLSIIAARPAMGKTALAMNILSNVCVKQKKSAMIFSLEMTREELAMRMISEASSVSGTNLRSANLSDAEWDRLIGCFDKLCDSALYIDDQSGLSIEELRDRARRRDKLIKTDLIVIDYLQLLHSNSRKAQNREQEVSDIARGLKCLAKDISCPVIALAQLNRSVESRAEKRPILSDLRESGSIEQDADNVMFIHRPGYYDKNERQDDAEIIISKQRGGPTGIVHIKWNGSCTMFSDFEQDKKDDEENKPDVNDFRNPFIDDTFDDEKGVDISW
jgi:replicative DNA helicase